MKTKSSPEPVTPAAAYEPRKGDFFTIEKWTSHTDNSWVGACLEVRVVDGHFLRVRECNFPSFSNFTLDTRRIEIRPLSKEFVTDHLAPNKPRP